MSFIRQESYVVSLPIGWDAFSWEKCQWRRVNSCSWMLRTARSKTFRVLHCNRCFQFLSSTFKIWILLVDFLHLDSTFAFVSFLFDLGNGSRWKWNRAAERVFFHFFVSGSWTPFLKCRHSKSIKRPLSGFAFEKIIVWQSVLVSRRNFCFIHRPLSKQRTFMVLFKAITSRANLTFAETRPHSFPFALFLL